MKLVKFKPSNIACIIKKLNSFRFLGGGSCVGQAHELPSRSRKATLIICFFKGLTSTALFFSLYSLALVYYPVLREELFYRLDHNNKQQLQALKLVSLNLGLPQPDQIAHSMAAQTSVSRFGQLLGRATANSFPAVSNTEFYLYIPKINARSPIISNVDPKNEAEYRSALKKGIAHARGSSLPGMNGIIYLFAHSTDSWANVSRYNAIFYLLRKLEPGDSVYILFNHIKYAYRVTDKKITSAKDTQYFKPQPNKEVLIMQTCWPPGTSLKRLLVWAERQ